MLSLANLFLVAFVALTALITVIDARTYKIPNKLLIVLSIIGLLSLLILSREGIGVHLLVAMVTLAIGYFLYLFTGFGAGDAKFFTVIMLWFGADGIIPMLYWFGVCCAVLVLLLVTARRFLDGKQTRLGGWRPLQKGAPVPLALAIGPAAVITFVMLANNISF